MLYRNYFDVGTTFGFLFGLGWNGLDNTCTSNMTASTDHDDPLRVHELLGPVHLANERRVLTVLTNQNRVLSVNLAGPGTRGEAAPVYPDHHRQRVSSRGGVGAGCHARSEEGAGRG